MILLGWASTSVDRSSLELTIDCKGVTFDETLEAYYQMWFTLKKQANLSLTCDNHLHFSISVNSRVLRRLCSSHWVAVPSCEEGAGRLSSSIVKTSKFLSYVLRHRPDDIGLALDANRWALVEVLISRANAASISLDRELLHEIVRTNDKQRFQLSDDGTRIRANQGHSVEVDLALDPVEPPETLYHGTASRFLESILKQGLRPMGRQHVHLSRDPATATRVGQRHGDPVVLEVQAAAMSRTGDLFYLAANGVWLTKRVEPNYLRLLRDGSSLKRRGESSER